jgi:hypothetical protein
VDLLAAAFVVLARAFFESGSGLAHPRGQSPLPPKANTQDDPFDVRVGELLDAGLTSVRGRPTEIARAAGPLISPDLVAVDRRDALAALTGPPTPLPEQPVPWALALEVKKLNWKQGATVVRSGGLDYNSTPPTPVARVVAPGLHESLPLPASYLFAILKPDSVGRGFLITGMVMCSGSALDASDVEYLRATGSRNKRINLGSYGDGMDRVRPMYVFPNPLSVQGWSTTATLISERPDLETEYPQLRRLGSIERTVIAPPAPTRRFSYYRLDAHVLDGVAPIDLVDPFQRVATRTEATAGRGRFVLRLQAEPGDTGLGTGEGEINKRR